jgi:3-methyladenine DNA glycosylase AlkD
MARVDDVVQKIRLKARPEQLAGMARFAITGDKRLGLSVPDMRRIARELGKDHSLALDLWKSGIPDARIIAAMIAEPEKLTENQMENWVKGIDSWDVCDQVCMNLFDKSHLAWKKIRDWSGRDEEFVKRTAFSLIACLAWHDKEARDEQFTALLQLIEQAADDERNFVKKAVNWALRHIGKRNLNLNQAAIKTAKKIQKNNSRTARWIATDALRELTSTKVQKRLKK